MERTEDREWWTFGLWEVSLEREQFRIFPKGPDGKSIPVTLRRVYVHLRRKLKNDTYATLFFKYYLHQRNFYWADSRHDKGSCPRHHVESELARLLFKGDKENAKRLVDQATSML